MLPSVEYCSLKYLDIYQQFDKNLIEGFKGESKTNRLEILKNGATAFRIARNFKDFENDKNKKSILSLLY